MATAKQIAKVAQNGVKHTSAEFQKLKKARQLAEIGFASQKRAEAEESRKAEKHAVQIATAKMRKHETAYLLKSEAMKQRLLSAKGRQTGISLDDALTKLGAGHRGVRGSCLVDRARSIAGMNSAAAAVTIVRYR